MRIGILIGIVALVVACGDSPAATSTSQAPANAGTCIYAPYGTYTITVTGNAAAAGGFCRTTDESMMVKQAASQTVCTLHSSDGAITLEVKTEEANRADAQAACDRLKKLYPG